MTLPDTPDLATWRDTLEATCMPVWLLEAAGAVRCGDLCALEQLARDPGSRPFEDLAERAAHTMGLVTVEEDSEVYALAGAAHLACERLSGPWLVAATRILGLAERAITWCEERVEDLLAGYPGEMHEAARTLIRRRALEAPPRSVGPDVAGLSLLVHDAARALHAGADPQQALRPVLGAVLMGEAPPDARAHAQATLRAMRNRREIAARELCETMRAERVAEGTRSTYDRAWAGELPTLLEDLLGRRADLPLSRLLARHRGGVRKEVARGHYDRRDDGGRSLADRVHSLDDDAREAWRGHLRVHDAAAAAAGQETLERIRAALNRIAPSDRDLLLAVYGGRSQASVAVDLGISQQAVSKRARAAERNLLRAWG